MRLLDPVELAVLPTGGLLAEQGHGQAFLHERLAHPIHCGGPTVDRLGNLRIVPAWPAFANIGFEQNLGVQDYGRCPFPSAAQFLQMDTLCIGQTNNIFGQRHGQAPGRGNPCRKTHALLKVNLGRLKH